MGKLGLLPHGAQASCETVDGISRRARHLVHEFGYSVVRAFDMAGIRDPDVVRRLIYAVWLGAREPGNKPAASSPQILRTLNAAWPNMQNAEALHGFLSRTTAHTIAPLSPSRAMLNASLAEMGKHAIVGKEEKHRLRLEAALKAHAAMLNDWRPGGKADG